MKTQLINSPQAEIQFMESEDLFTHTDSAQSE